MTLFRLSPSSPFRNAAMSARMAGAGHAWPQMTRAVLENGDPACPPLFPKLPAVTPMRAVSEIRRAICARMIPKPPAPWLVRAVLETIGIPIGPQFPKQPARSTSNAEGLLGDWLHAAAYCRIKPVVEVEKKVRRRRADVVAAVELGIGNGRVESINQKIRVTVKVGYGFRNTDNLIALLMLRCSDEHPALPWEDRKDEKRKRDERKRTDRERDRKRRKEKASRTNAA